MKRSIYYDAQVRTEFLVRLPVKVSKVRREGKRFKRRMEKGLEGRREVKRD